MRALRIALLLSLAVNAAGCAGVQPWVKPYERERLADRVMAWDRDPIMSGYITHVRENREGARGGTGEAGGGCGCN
ncbi:MAG: DUF4266 domain-containing protein [Proteobacteria bacterium]|nr:DUF4266 domain-containing protein [Pseudomonadota bacterium]